MAGAQVDEQPALRPRRYLNLCPLLAEVFFKVGVAVEA